MGTRSLLVALVALTGCSRASETPSPRVVPEPTREAKAEVPAPVADAGARAKAPAAPSPFTIVARAPTSVPYEHTRTVSTGVALVQRLPGGGLVVASEYGRARADGPGALSVELIGAGLETQVLYRPAMVQGREGMRWVWSDAALAIAVFEEDRERVGPHLASFKIGANGFQALRPGVGYWSAALRDGSVLALERTAYEIPNSSIYPKGSGYEQNAWSLKPARIAVLSGKAIAPTLPAGVCPTSMSAAPDGALIVTVEKCAASGDEWTVGALRFAPTATQAKLEWFPPRSGERSPHGLNPDDITTFAASANEIYIGDGDRLRTWNGKEWAVTAPFPSDKLASISRAPSGELWAVAGGRLVKRNVDGKTWSEVALPAAPGDPLDEATYAPPDFESSHFLKVATLPEGPTSRPRPHESSTVSALTVDATAEEVLVLAAVEQEALVLSTKPRSPMARLPSLETQRARIAQKLKRRVAASPKDCEKQSFLVLAETTTVDALRAAFGGVQAGDGGKTVAKMGEGIVESQKRLLVYGEPEGIVAAGKRLAALGPKRLCGPAVVEREL